MTNNNGQGQQMTAVQKRDQDLAVRQSNLKTMLMKSLPSIAGMAGKLVNPERLIRLALVASSRKPRLLDCSPNSILSSLLQAAQMGLEPETPLQHAYLIPRKNGKTGTTEACFEPSYRGLITVATRAGEIKAIWARLVYANEHYDVEYGTEDKLVHKPILDEELRGELVGVYSVARMKDGTTQFEPMTLGQVEAIRARSQSGNDPNAPWGTDYEEMVKKTAIKRLIKRLPTDNERLATLIQHDNEMEQPDRPLENEALSVLGDDVVDAATAGATRAEAMAAELNAKRERKTRAKAEAKTEAKAETPAASAAAGPPSQNAPLPGQTSLPMSDAEKKAIVEQEKEREPGADDDPIS